MSIEKLGVVIPFYNEEAALPGTLDAIYHQKQSPQLDVILVDNGSTDRSRDAIRDFQNSHSDLPLHVIEEAQKGTGVASDTGFREAISRGHAIVARTDADTHPRSDWTHNINQHMSNDPQLRLLGGISKPLHDKYYQPMDNIVTRPLVALGRLTQTIEHRELWPLRAAIGHNLAVRADAYEAVDGFPHTSILEKDEDKVLSQRIYREFGFRAMSLERDIAVFTSARRLRRVGSYADAFLYYIKTDPEYRLRKTNGDIDVR